MPRFVMRLCVPVFAFLLIACSDGTQVVKLADNQLSVGRAEVSLNEKWEFYKGSLSLEEVSFLTASDKEWEPINLPHTWNAEDGYDGGNNYFRGDGWYRKQIKVSDSLAGKRFYLHFDAANLITDVYVDGQHVGEHRGGYAAFRFDLTDYMTPGAEHELAIKVNNERNNDIAPLSADYTFFGGIYRDLSLIVTDQDHIELMDYASAGVFLHQQSLSDERAEVRADINLVNKQDQAVERVLEVSIVNAEGETLQRKSQAVSIPAAGKVSELVELAIDNPRRWNGVIDPYLYQVAVQLKDTDRVVDSITQPLGLRTFEVDPEKGLLLNGEYYDVKGVNRHQDLEGKGWAISDEDHKRDFEIIADMGTTGVRLAHYQHDPYVYQLMNEMGFVTWAEIPVINEVPESQAFEDNAAEQLKELIRQNFNHPSILFWGISNEVSMTGLTPGGVEILKRLNVLAKQEDDSRVTTAAVLGHHQGDDIWYVNDIVAQNVYYGWYYEKIADIGKWADESRAAFPNRAFGVSEYGAGAGPSIHTAEPKKGDHSEEFQNLYHEGNWEELKQRPFVWSKFIWNMFDFAVDGRDEGERPGMNDKGLVTYDRKTYKDSFYWYKANWSKEPVLYVTSRRFTERKRAETDVKIYTNLRDVELQVNGQSIGSKSQTGEYKIIWSDIELSMGENTIEVVGRDAEGKLQRDKVQWTRVENDDTRIAAVDGVLGIDLQEHRVFHVPYGTTVESLKSLIKLPYGASLDMSQTGEGSTLVAVGDKFEVVASNGDRQAYQIAEGALSVARPIKVNAELAHGMMGYPAAPAYKAVDGEAVASVDMDAAKELEVSPVWLTGDPSGNRGGQFKIDLGANYYIDSLEATWLSGEMSENGKMLYTIELAKDVALDETVFVETYETVVDKSDNEISHRTQDDIQKIARYVRINILDSTYFFEIPLIGKFKLVGATELSVDGGLLFSHALDVDYGSHVISIPRGMTMVELTENLQLVSDEYQLLLKQDGQIIDEGQPLTEQQYVVVASKDAVEARKERYALLFTDPAKAIANND
ncbi:hypothetical protein R50073_43030 [Maricurvus nonylphenolicus]|uniref:glycoside hydrolase family 2 protein n=1 Tax=Maricurvus nonylphenolicus TaxID=1008307 RepID=UPI0036F39092